MLKEKLIVLVTSYNGFEPWDLISSGAGFNYHHTPFVCAWYKESHITRPYR